MAARAAGPLAGRFASTGRDALIVDALRTPIGRSHPERGWFRDVHPNAMLGAVYTVLLDGAGLGPEVIEDLIVGCTAPFGEQSRNIARNAWLQAGPPPDASNDSRPASRPNHACTPGCALLVSMVIPSWHADDSPAC